MHFSVFVAVVALASLATARKCGTKEPSPEIVQANTDAMKAYSAGALAKAKPPGEPLIINTYIHVLQAGNTSHEGNVPNDQIYAQVYPPSLPPFITHTHTHTHTLADPHYKMEVLEADYASTNISFKLIKINRPPINEAWFNNRSEMAMRAALRKCTYADLNIYLQQPTTGILGYCYFPVGNLTDNLLHRDGCTVLFSTLLSRRGYDGSLDRTERGLNAAPWSGSPWPRSRFGRGGR